MARPATPILSPSSRIPDLVEGHIPGKDLDMEAQERTVFRCTVCDWYYLSEEGLWNHVQLHDIPDQKRKSHCEELITSSVLYECEQCNDQRLYEEDGYNQHIIVGHVLFPEHLNWEYHDEPPTEQVSIKCECTDCGDIFANHDLLLQHVEEAHRIIACRICAATFNDDIELDNHKELQMNFIF